MDELKPCPFCGRKQSKMFDIYQLGFRQYWVKCSRCFCQGPIMLFRQDAVDAWNRRTQPEWAAGEGDGLATAEAGA